LRKWIKHYEEKGIEGLHELSRKPHNSPASKIDYEQKEIIILIWLPFFGQFQQRKIKTMSTKQKNNYPLEFKVSSAQLAIDSEQSIAKTARDLGVNHNTLHGWIYQSSLKPEQNPALVYQGTRQRGDADHSARKNLYRNPKDFRYIEVFYNRIRIHSVNNYLAPVEFEEINKKSLKYT